MAISPDSAFEFWGEHSVAADDRGRVLVPTEYREKLPKKFVLTRGPDKAIFLYPLDVWQQIEEQLKLQVLHRQAGILQRILGARTFVEVDSSWRINIPSPLQEYAGIKEKSSVTIVGQGSKIEIWASEEWRKFTATFDYDLLLNNAEDIGMAEYVERRPRVAEPRVAVA